MRCYNKTAYACLLITGLAFAIAGSAIADKPDRKRGGPSYNVIKLDDAGGAVECWAFDANDSRLVVGVAQDFSSSVQSACFWNVEKTRRTYRSTLQFLASGDLIQSKAKGCNESGEIVGEGLTANGKESAVYWAHQNDLAQSLPSPSDGLWYSAASINNDGVICGTSGTFIPGQETAGVVWRVTADGIWGPMELEILDPDPLGMDMVSANDVSDQDESGVVTIAGQSNGNAVTWRVTLSTDGGLVAGTAEILSSNADVQGINNLGIACGSAAFAPNKAAAWIAEIPIALDTGSSPYSATAEDVNDSGTLVGSSGIDSSAVVWPDPASTMISLNRFLRNSPFDYLKKAYAVNPSGDIVGYGVVNETRGHAAFLAIPK